MKIIYLVFILMLIPLISAEFTFYKTINGTGEDYEDLDEVFDTPVSIWVDNSILYISDTDENLVYIMEDNEIYRKLGDSDDHTNELYRPRSLYMKEGVLYICDSNEGEIKVYDKKPKLSIFSKDKNFFIEPWGITFLDGYYYIIDNQNSRLYIHNEDESYNRTYINLGRFSGQLDSPSDIFAGPDNQLYIADTGNDRIEVFYSNLTFFQDIGKGRGGVLLNKPQGVFVNEKFVFVADT
ncbi:MAG: NHL repeat-containing protein, partial [Candidatus Micrarchaeia archaeon]